MISIRPEQSDDIAAIRIVNERAFGQTAEAKIVDLLRVACSNVISLVAITNYQIVGHIFFSPVTLAYAGDEIKGMGLAPMAVLSEYQRHGIGSQLVEAGLNIIRNQGCPYMIVVGHPEYYPRFGFVPAFTHDLRCQWEEVPNDAFMVLILNEAVMAGVSGTVKYRDELNEAM